MTSTIIRRGVRQAVGESPQRTDGIPKLIGNFAFVSDLHAEDMLFAEVRRSPYAHGRIRHIDTTPALAMSGVIAVLSPDDTTGMPGFGLLEPDQPVLAREVVNYWGEPIAVVAADDRETARRAAKRSTSTSRS